MWTGIMLKTAYLCAHWAACFKIAHNGERLTFYQHNLQPKADPIRPPPKPTVGAERSWRNKGVAMTELFGRVPQEAFLPTTCVSFHSCRNLY